MQNCFSQTLRSSCARKTNVRYQRPKNSFKLILCMRWTHNNDFSKGIYWRLQEPIDECHFLWIFWLFCLLRLWPTVHNTPIIEQQTLQSLYALGVLPPGFLSLKIFPTYQRSVEIRSDVSVYCSNTVGKEPCVPIPWIASPLFCCGLRHISLDRWIEDVNAVFQRLILLLNEYLRLI